MNTDTISLASKDNFKIDIESFQPESGVKAVIFVLASEKTTVDFLEVYEKELIDKGVQVIRLMGSINGFTNRNTSDQDIIGLLAEDLEAAMAYSRAEHIDVPFFLFGQGLGGHVAMFYLLSRKVKEINAVFLLAPWLIGTLRDQPFNLLPSNEEGFSSGKAEKKLVKALNHSKAFIEREAATFNFGSKSCLLTDKVDFIVSFNLQVIVSKQDSWKKELISRIKSLV